MTFALTPQEVLAVSYAESFAQKVRLSLVSAGHRVDRPTSPLRTGPVIRIILAVNDNRLADHLSGLATESDELEIASILRDPQELRGALPRTDIDAVIVHDRRGAVPLIEITRELTVAHPDLGLVLVVSDSSPEVLRSGMQAGARDVITEPIGLEQLETSALAAAAWTQALRRRAARDAHGELVGLGRVVTIVGAKGGVGTTTIAVHLALAARELGEASVCLVEYDLQAGDLRAFLDLPYRRSVVDLAAVADELTSRASAGDAVHARQPGCGSCSVPRRESRPSPSPRRPPATS